MNEFTSSQKIKDIVNKFPNATEIFKSYHIDFCCGGDQPLIHEIEEHNINEKELLEKLNSEYKRIQIDTNTNFTEYPLDKLVDHILNKHHAYLYENLPRISELTTKILRVHGDHHPELLRVHKLFNNLRTELESHLIKEETVQYPAIKEYLKTKKDIDLDRAISVIKSLEEEHTGAGNILKELRKITNDYRVPDDGCSTYRLTYEKLEEMEADLFQHIHLENNILFPRLTQLKK
jgi:regulator of cell morphogenesis and NO signaling